MANSKNEPNKKNAGKKSRLYAVSSLKRKLNQFESIHNLLRRFMAARASYAIPKKRYAILLEATPLFPEGAKNHKITINILNLRRLREIVEISFREKQDPSSTQCNSNENHVRQYPNRIR